MLHHQIKMYSSEQGYGHRRMKFSFPDSLSLVKGPNVFNYMAVLKFNMTNSIVTVSDTLWSNANFAIEIDGNPATFQVMPAGPYYGIGAVNTVLKNYQDTLGWRKYNAITNTYNYPITMDVDDIAGRYVIRSDPTNFPVAFPPVTSLEFYVFTDGTLTNGIGKSIGANQQLYQNLTGSLAVYTLPLDPPLLDIIENGVDVRLYDGPDIRVYEGAKNTTVINKESTSLITIDNVVNEPVNRQVRYASGVDGLVFIPFTNGDIRTMEVRLYSTLLDEELYFTNGDTFMQATITQQINR